MIKDDSPLAGGGDSADMHERIRVVDSNGKQWGIMTLLDATKLADSKGAKLLKITQTVSPPIYRLIEKGSKFWKKVEKPRWKLEE
jgi:translation initiation factor IF-3